MRQPIALFIGLHYMHGGHASEYFRSFTSWLSVIGITLGVMALITVLSVMNGFEKDLEKNILGLIPQALITSTQGSINPNLLPALQLQKLRSVYCVKKLTVGDVVLQSANSVAVGVMLGVHPDEPDPLTPYLINTNQQQLQPNQYSIIIGERLASQLGVKRGDALRLMVPSASQLTPIGRIPSQRLFTIIGTFHTNSEVDSYEFLTNQEDASRLMHYPAGNITGWRLFLKQPLLVNTLSQQSIPKDTVWKDWRERKGDLFQAINMEKNIMGLLLTLIIAIAAFNIMTSLGLLVMEKQSEVAILKTLGLTRSKIMAVFIVHGASAGIIGSLLGTILGLLLASNLNNLTLGINFLIYHTSIPVVIDPLQVMTIAFVAIVISLISTIYPSWLAGALEPAKTLRYE